MGRTTLAAVRERVVLRGPRVVLRPFRAREEPAIWRGRLAMSPSMKPTAASRDRIRRIVQRSGMLYRGRLDLAIVARGRLIGEIQARGGTSHRPMPLPGVFEIGIVIWNPRDRGHGYGVEAVALMTRWLLSEQRAPRVQLSTAVHNATMRRAAEKIGFAFEGILRAYLPSDDGGRDDYAMYAVTSVDELR
jgi:RimJ/RimL family protein N-acetyltransferase